MYNVCVNSLSRWVNAVRSLVQFQINRLIMSINTKAAAVFKDSDVAETLSIINGQYVVSSDNTPYNFLFLNTFLFTVHYTYKYVFVYRTLYIPIRFCLLDIIHTNTFLFTGHYTYQYVFVYWTLYIPIRFCLLDIIHTNTFLFTGHYTYQYVFVYWTLYMSSKQKRIGMYNVK
jgi:ubiquitin C-terminal hydrolase